MWSLHRFSRPNLFPSVVVYGLSVLGLSSFSSFSSSSSSIALCEENKKQKIALSKQSYRSFPIRQIETLNHNVKRITFDLPDSEYEMGLITSSCLLTQANINGKTISRPYTPTNLNTEKGFLELVIKEYPNGLMSRYLSHLQVGDVVDMKGPFLKFNYKENEYKKIGLIAGGSGITPMIQLIKTICRNEKDTTEIVLIYANKTKEDIILLDELNALRYHYPQLTIHHILSEETSEEWKGLKGYITKELIQELFPSPEEKDSFICVCGPPPMMYAISGDKAKDRTQGELQGLLKELNYTSKQVFKF